MKRVLMLAALIVLLSGGCSQADVELLPGDQSDAEELHAVARSLVPKDSRILAAEDGGCEMFRDFPDCRTVSFYDAHEPDRERRVEAAEETARNAGWTLTSSPDVMEGGTWLEFERDGYTAWVSIREHEENWRNYCEGVPVNDRDFIDACPDKLQVQREGS